MSDRFKISVRLSDYGDDYRAIHVKSENAWDGWSPIAKAYDDDESRQAVDELVSAANRAERLERVRSVLQRLHDDCCVTYKERLDVGPMLAPSELAVLDARRILEELSR